MIARLLNGDDTDHLNFIPILRGLYVKEKQKDEIKQRKRENGKKNIAFYITHWIRLLVKTEIKMYY